MENMTDTDVNFSSVGDDGCIHITKGDGELREIVLGGIKYLCNNEKAVVTGYTRGIPQDVTIPAEIDGIPVTDIAENAFENCTFENVVIEANVTKISRNCFYSCESLKK